MRRGVYGEAGYDGETVIRNKRATVENAACCMWDSSCLPSSSAKGLPCGWLQGLSVYQVVFFAKDFHLIVRRAQDAGKQLLTRYSVVPTLQFLFSVYIQKRTLCHYEIIFRQRSTWSGRESFCSICAREQF